MNLLLGLEWAGTAATIPRTLSGSWITPYGVSFRLGNAQGLSSIVTDLPVEASLTVYTGVIAVNAPANVRLRQFPGVVLRPWDLQCQMGVEWEI